MRREHEAKASAGMRRSPTKGQARAIHTDPIMQDETSSRLGATGVRSSLLPVTEVLPHHCSTCVSQSSPPMLAYT